MSELKQQDPEVYNAIKGEEERELSKIVLIASENYVSRAVLEAQGSVFTNKYAEGYPNRRYYGGCEFADAVEVSRHRAGKAALRRGARERPAPLRLFGEHGGLLQRAPARRHDPRHGACPRRPPDPRGERELLGPRSTSPFPTAWTKRPNCSITTRWSGLRWSTNPG